MLPNLSKTLANNEKKQQFLEDRFVHALRVGGLCAATGTPTTQAILTAGTQGESYISSWKLFFALCGSLFSGMNLILSGPIVPNASGAQRAQLISQSIDEWMIGILFFVNFIYF